MKNDVIYLITTEETTDEDGFPITTNTKHKVMAEIMSVKRSEYYQATTAGVTVSIVARLNRDDYERVKRVGKPNFAMYESIKYKIVRTYLTDRRNIELTLSEVE